MSSDEFFPQNREFAPEPDEADQLAVDYVQMIVAKWLDAGQPLAELGAAMVFYAANIAVVETLSLPKVAAMFREMADLVEAGRDPPRL